MISTYSLINKLLQTKYCFSWNYRIDSFFQAIKSSCFQRQSQCTSVFIETRTRASAFSTSVAKSSVLGGQMEVKVKNIRSFFIYSNFSGFSHGFLVFSTQTTFVYKKTKELSEIVSFAPYGHQKRHLHFFGLNYFI